MPEIIHETIEINKTEDFYYEYQRVTDTNISKSEIKVINIKIMRKSNDIANLFAYCDADLSDVDLIKIKVMCNSDTADLDFDKIKDLDNIENVNMQLFKDEVFTIDMNELYEFFTFKRIHVYGDGNKYKTRIKFVNHPDFTDMIEWLSFYDCDIINPINELFGHGFYLEFNHCTFNGSMRISFSGEQKAIVRINDCKFNKCTEFVIGNAKCVTLMKMDISFDEKNKSTLLNGISFNKIEECLLTGVNIFGYNETVSFDNVLDLQIIDTNLDFKRICDYNKLVIRTADKVKIIGNDMINIAAISVKELVLAGTNLDGYDVLGCKYILYAENCDKVNVSGYTIEKKVAPVLFELKSCKNFNMSQCNTVSDIDVIHVTSNLENIIINDCKFINVNCVISGNNIFGDTILSNIIAKDCKKVLSLKVGDNLILSDINILGNKSLTQLSESPRILDVGATGFATIRVDNCTFERAAVGFDGIDITVNENTFTNCVNAVKADGTYNDTGNTHFGNTSIVGFKLNVPCEINIDKTVFYDNIPYFKNIVSGIINNCKFTKGITLENCYCEKFKITGNSFGFENTPFRGINMINCKHIEFYNNPVILDDPEVFISLTGCTGCFIKNNPIMPTYSDDILAKIKDLNGVGNIYIIDKSMNEQERIAVISQTNMFNEMVTHFASAQVIPLGITKIRDADDMADKIENIICQLDLSEEWTRGFIASVKQFVLSL